MHGLPQRSPVKSAIAPRSMHRKMQAVPGVGGRALGEWCRWPWCSARQAHASLGLSTNNPRPVVAAACSYRGIALTVASLQQRPRLRPLGTHPGLQEQQQRLNMVFLDNINAKVADSVSWERACAHWVAGWGPSASSSGFVPGRGAAPFRQRMRRCPWFPPQVCGGGAAPFQRGLTADQQPKALCPTTLAAAGKPGVRRCLCARTLFEQQYCGPQPHAITPIRLIHKDTPWRLRSLNLPSLS